MLYTLPVEILDEVINYSPLNTQLVLSLVSTQFNTHAARHIYRKIVLTSVSSVVQCSRTLSAKPAFANAVRSLSIKIGSPHPICFTAYYSSLKAALGVLPRLTDLEILAHGEPYSAAISQCTFPFLTRFECAQSLTPSLASFLNRHPTISYLQVAPSDKIWPDSDTDSSTDVEDDGSTLGIEDSPHPTLSNHPMKIILPNLQCFVGNGECIEPITRSSPLLRAAFVFWDFAGDDIEGIFSALAAACGDSLMMLSCRRRGWNTDLIDSVSRILPGIRAFVVTNVLTVDAHPTDETLWAIQASLKRFTELERLMLHCVDLWQTGDVECRMDRDWETAMTWGAACPSLSEITFPHGLKWVRLRDHEDNWAPDTSTLQGFTWACDMIRSKKCPRWRRWLRLLAERAQADMECHSDFVETASKYKEALEEVLDNVASDEQDVGYIDDG
ncbi:hypothetical protein HGRIS_014376 [Hohenbuehelia grisea]|uniref:F-box domain-containing protein n=1 Tax=Hohenbuehelia grisea TaxID=104357 RepID=A0ABR3JU73_9AGAR